MKLKQPSNRFDLAIQKRNQVLEVGGGHNPHPRSNVVVDKFVDSNYHRKSDLKVLKHQQFIQADGASLPFEDKAFDYVICNHVLEHVDDPAAFLDEQTRVAKSGYLETPSLIGEYLFPKESHKWLILELDNQLVLFEKEKYWFKSNLDFGFLFLSWLPRVSLGYKILMNTHPNFMTVRYQWKNSIEYIVNPKDKKYLEYFSREWTEEMVKKFFPPKSKVAELKDAASAFGGIILRNLTG
jgi:ubiquinone/menaquinone biosynthesis C-methylase UbiE